MLSNSIPSLVAVATLREFAVNNRDFEVVYCSFVLAQRRTTRIGLSAFVKRAFVEPSVPGIS